MKNCHLFFLLLICSQFSLVGYAMEQKINAPKGISVEKAYLRASIPGSSVSSAYMSITNNSEKPITLVGASSDASARIEIHQHTMESGFMRMRKLDSINIKVNERVILQPSGLHFMLFDVTKPLQADHQVELTLHFSNKNSLELQIPVYSPIQEKKAQESEQHISTMHHHH